MNSADIKGNEYRVVFTASTQGLLDKPYQQTIYTIADNDKHLRLKMFNGYNNLNIIDIEDLTESF